MAESVIVAAFIRGRAGKKEELAVRLQALVLASRSDPGVINYDLHHSTDDPALWFLYERYESQEHLNRHRGECGPAQFPFGRPDTRGREG
jgi:quinol monooxygenase YgiN